MTYYTPLEQIREVGEESMVDVAGGAMSIDELFGELITTMLIHHPEYIVITIEKDRRMCKYKSTVYIPQEDFDAQTRRRN